MYLILNLFLIEYIINSLFFNSNYSVLIKLNIYLDNGIYIIEQFEYLLKIKEE